MISNIVIARILARIVAAVLLAAVLLATFGLVTGVAWLALHT